MTEQTIYLDHQATTPVDERVLEAMLPFFRERFGNPHSTEHGIGRDAAEVVEAARGQVAALIGAEAREVVFTSGATESNNLAILGAGRFRRPERDHVVTVATEHKCVLEACHRLEAEGMRLTILPVDATGQPDLDALREAVDERTAIVSVMAANNEIGVVPPLAEIGRICREAGAWFHTDAAQAFGKIPLDVRDMSIDLLSASGHKVYGPKGVGVLYVRRRPRVRLEVLFQGGGQERGLRSGTLPTPLVVGLGAAAEVAAEGMGQEASRLKALRSRFVSRLEAAVGPLTIHGDMDERLPGNLSIAIPGVPARDLMDAVPGVAVSSGSACSSAAIEPSYVLRALGVDDATAACSFRVGLGRDTSGGEVDRAVDLLADGVRRVRAAGAGASVIA